jgi:TolA-binding protein
VKPDELIDRLSYLAREASGSGLTAGEQAGLPRLERTLAKRGVRRSRVRFVRWLAVAAAVLSIAVVLFMRRERALTFEVTHGRVSGGGYIVSDASDAVVRFSDQSELGMESGTRLRVDRLEVRGARMMLEGGLVHAHIRPRPEATWSIDAGPYVIHVTGTEFDLAWDVDAQTLDVRLRKGRVTVQGPMANGNIYMEAGQHLVANARDGSLSINERITQSSPAANATEKVDFETARPNVAAQPGASSSLQPGNPTVVARTAAPPRAGGAAGTSPSWTVRVAQGNFQEVIEDAERRGVDRTLADGSLADLAALADAARYGRRQDIARRVLIAERMRFPGSVRAEDAAFFLGDLAEGSNDDATSLDWNETYLRESPDGAYASQALGRKMMIVQRLRGTDEARPLAVTYLQRFPDGPYTSYARKLLQSR